MDKRFNKLEEKLDKISVDLGEIKVVQAEQAADLKYHIKRTDQIENKLLPLVDIKTKFDGACTFIGKCGVVGGFIFGAIKAIETVISWF